MNAVLTGDATVGCVWLQPTHVGAQPRVDPLWPEGFSAEFNPVRVFDAEGRLVATEGDELALAGGFADGEAPRDYPTACNSDGELWSVGDVMRVEGGPR
jgi:hypothetical protein